MLGMFLKSEVEEAWNHENALFYTKLHKKVKRIME